MKLILRTIPILLVLCCLMSLSACGNSTAGTEDTGTMQPTDTSDILYDEDGYLRDRLPADLNYEEQDFRILYWNNAPTYEFSVDKESERSTIEEAVFSRNSTLDQ